LKEFVHICGISSDHEVPSYRLNYPRFLTILDIILRKFLFTKIIFIFIQIKSNTNNDNDYDGYCLQENKNVCKRNLTLSEIMDFTWKYVITQFGNRSLFLGSILTNNIVIDPKHQIIFDDPFNILFKKCCRYVVRNTTTMSWNNFICRSISKLMEFGSFRK